jgi:thiamine kinase-like enzyme
MATAPHMLCHGDARLDNIFFGSPDGKQPLTFVDWQIAVRARGPYDIGYFTSQSMQPADRKTHEEELLRGYYDKLAKAGVKNYSWEQCWEDYRVSVLFCLAYPVIAGGSIDLANERGVALGNAMTDRSIAAIAELDCASLLERFAPVA